MRCHVAGLALHVLMVMASSAGTSSVVGFVLGTTISWAGGIIQHWWNGPTCYQVPAEHFASLRPCNDCSHVLEQPRSTTTTTTVIWSSTLGWDFWRFVRFAMLCGACLALCCMAAVCYLIRCYFGSNGWARVFPVAYAADVVDGPRLQPPPVLALQASKEATARAQVAFIRGRLAGLPVAE